MKRHTDIAIVYNARTHGHMARILRDAFEIYALHTSLLSIHQERDVRHCFCERLPKFSYTFLLAHGDAKDPVEPHVNFDTVKPRNGNYDDPDSWEGTESRLTSDAIRNLDARLQGTLVSTACGSGNEILARAFFRTGIRNYVAPTGNYSDAMSGQLFCITLIHFLRTDLRDHPTKHYSLEEAVELARNVDPHYAAGTKLFQVFSQGESPP